METQYPGIFSLVLGEPESVTPLSLRHFLPAADAIAQLPTATLPFSLSGITGRKTVRGYEISLPLAVAEQIYGLGLQLRSCNQRGKKKTLRVNSDPTTDLGDSHAPVPFYVTTAGYGVLVDTARYATFYCGTAQPKIDRRQTRDDGQDDRLEFVESAKALYEAHQAKGELRMIVEIPGVSGVTLYLFAGPDMRSAVQRYNLFSGGGCLPPRWGLGVWYRCRADFSDQQVLEMAKGFRQDAMPCDVLGLEPGWQTQSYACSYVWNPKTFPDPATTVSSLAKDHYHVNLWEHVYTHPTSPIYGDLFPLSGDYEVFSKGLVPDLTLPQAREIYANFHEKTHVQLGVSGYKLDECDGSDYIAWTWAFPELSAFPSGIDGEQMHSLLGVQYQETINSIYRKHNQRTYSEVRSSHALASPYPFVLYSDLYEFPDFLRGLVNCGFSGLLWCPEVRHATSSEDLLRRLQMVVFSPQALINAWYIKHAPWKQWQSDENNADVFLDDWQSLEEQCRRLLALRMQFIPYLYSAFYDYALTGLPPFRAVVMDYPNDEQAWMIDDAYLMGDRLLVAPVQAGQSERTIYLPEGEWVDFWTDTRYHGGQTITRQVGIDEIPLFVKDGSVLPLAQPALHTEEAGQFELTVRVYGDGRQAMSLFEDDGVSYDFEQGAFNRVSVGWDEETAQATLSRKGDLSCQRYAIKDVERH